MIEPGAIVYVKGLGRSSRAEVLRVSDKGGSLRVRMAASGKERTVGAHRVSLEHEPVKPPGPLSADQRRLVANRVRCGRDVERALGATARPIPKTPALRSDRYMRYVRTQRCCSCGARESIEAHHWSHRGSSMGAKTDDFRTVPLCTTCHRHWHDHGTLPGRDRVGSESLFLRTQRGLLIGWVRAALTRVEDGVMVDALITAMREVET